MKTETLVVACNLVEGFLIPTPTGRRFELERRRTLRRD